MADGLAAEEPVEATPLRYGDNVFQQPADQDQWSRKLALLVEHT